MSADREPRDVIVAEYSYRHEAEFAAGFLADAGIPYRLEADDAGGIDAGVTMSRPARLWVRREDVTDALELLEVNPEALMSGAKAIDDLAEEDDPPATGTFIRAPSAAQDSEGVQPFRGGSSPAERDGAKLCGAERAVAGVLGAAFLGLSFGFEEVLSAGPGGSAWVVAVLLLGVVLVVSALVGRTWGPLRSFLRALSGVAP